MILNWAWEFAINGDKHRSNHGLVELIRSITTLDFSHYLAINNKVDRYNYHLEKHVSESHYEKSCEYCVNDGDKKGGGDDDDYNRRDENNGEPLNNGEPFPHFGHLIHLPFSSSLAHLNLSNTPIGFSSKFMKTLSHPIFKHLVTLDLSHADLFSSNLNPLFNAPHQLPNLHTLNLSHNEYLSIPQIATTNQFPNLKVLDITSTKINQTLQGFSAFDNAQQPPPPSSSSLSTSSLSSTTTTTSLPPPPQLPPFQLEKLVLLPYHADHIALLALSRSPHVSQLKELRINLRDSTSDTIRKLFDPERSMWKNLTHLDVGSDLDPFALQALGESSLLSNLISLDLIFNSTPTDLSHDEIQRRNQALQQFLHSPFLWTSKLKHLKLSHYPTTFNDFIPTLNTANIKLETLNLHCTPSTFAPFLTAPCLSELKELKCDGFGRDIPYFTSQQFLQLPFLSNLQHFPFTLGAMFSSQLLTILSSPKMSNNLIELDLSCYDYPIKDVIKAICTTRVNPGDETSPLKYGKLRKIRLSGTQVADDDIQLIVENLTGLTHLNVSSGDNDDNDDDDDDNLITDKTITTLLATERAHLAYPYTTLPNLTHLGLSASAITSNGLMELSKSQLFSQLEELDVSRCQTEPWNDPEDPALPPGLLALLTNPRVSNLRLLRLYGIIGDHIDLEEFRHLKPEIAKYFEHCKVEYR